MMRDPKKVEKSIANLKKFWLIWVAVAFAATLLCYFKTGFPIWQLIALGLMGGYCLYHHIRLIQKDSSARAFVVFLPVIIIPLIIGGSIAKAKGISGSWEHSIPTSIFLITYAWAATIYKFEIFSKPSPKADSK